MLDQRFIDALRECLGLDAFYSRSHRPTDVERFGAIAYSNNARGGRKAHGIGDMGNR